jgi:hypothetical protein
MKKLIENLKKTREDLFNAIHSLDYYQLNTSPNSDRWSITQVCHHLYLTEVLFTKAISQGLRNDIDAVTERKPIELVLDRTKKYESPDIAKPSENLYELQEIIDMLLKSREALNTLLNNIEDFSLLSRRSYYHPVFKELLLDQWVELLNLHEQRHIEQINEIKKLI